ncbi:MAG: type I restriction endonuclease subunit R [Proteobacteria bacterium]|nr:type I restriction endonuclease subunit R [Pseudomonadota bacterium]
MPNFISETQIEKAITYLLTKKFGWRHMDCFTKEPDALKDGSGRDNKTEVVLFDILKRQIKQINPRVPETAIDEVISKLTARRYAMSQAIANKEVYNLIRDGIPVEYENSKGKKERPRVKIIDFDNPVKNDFFVVTQLWVKGERYFRRPDVLLYVNGIPLVFIELKNSNIALRNAYDDNLINYRHDIPLLFQYNGLCILSNAIETKVGSVTSEWEHFFPWLRVDDEREKVDRLQMKKEGTSIERAIEGLCDQQRLLDYLENFILYYRDTNKIVAQNHQFIGVNKAIRSFEAREERAGKLGVFWHTQGAGKSFSMIFFVRKIFRKYTGNFSFVVITDRDDLDGQIYRSFLDTMTVKKNEAARPKDSEEMRRFLSLNKRIVFTLIHKFRWPQGKKYPLLSDRKDIIVIVDEAHRTQYLTLAENMRAGLPNAQYIAFTGTPLLGRERKTNAWFGDYVSEYNFVQSVDDEATVPLFYQKRVPEVLIQNEDLSEEFYRILEDENLDEKQQEKLEKEFATEIEVIKRDDRLETIAKDIVCHFPQRGYLGKGMVVCVDKFTAVKMHDKVQAHWKEEIKRLIGQIAKAKDDAVKDRLRKTVDYMRSVEMAVIVSEEAGEEKKFDAQQLDIRPHRKKMNALDKQGHDIEYRFKDPFDQLQLVFVCAMWLTGFDVHTLSTMYFDKPMKDHTLMQAIARANRVTSHEINDIAKKNGEIIDYYNVFRNMKKALADYAAGTEGRPQDMPVQEKDELFKLLDDALNESSQFCADIGIDLEEILGNDEIFRNIEAFNCFADKILEKDEWKKEFTVYENTVTALYEACKPEILSDKTRPLVPVFQYLRGVIDSIIQQQDIDSAKRRIATLLDESVVTADRNTAGADRVTEFQIIHKGRSLDLSKINFQKLKEDFKKREYKNIEIADLRIFIEHKLEQMIGRNSTRADFAQKLQQIIDRYNSGGSSTENYFDELVKFTEGLKDEEERAVREGLSEDELEIFDILKKEKMSKEEAQKVKLAARSLLQRLTSGRPKVLVQDWYKDSQTQEKVRTAVEKVLDGSLPESYDKNLFQSKCSNVFDLIYEYSMRKVKWAA